jgi:hypothetical protein
VLAVAAVVCGGPRAMAAAAAATDESRFALLVGANLGDTGEPNLSHAEEDAARLAETLRLLGRFPADQVVLMTSATASEVRDALIRLNARVRERPNGVLVVFYSGHADENALHLTGSHLGMSELKALIVGSPATSRLLIVDACRSGSLIGLKGGKAVTPFPIPTFREPVPEGFAVLASSAASEDSQESGTLKSSYFTYYLNAGLIGAADHDRDGAVTLSELYTFASAETRAATANSAAGPQNPTFQFALGGRHDLVLTHLGARDLRLGTLRFTQAGRYIVQRSTTSGWSAPVAEVGAHEDGAELALVPGTYRVVLRGERDVSQADYAVASGEVTSVELGQLVRLDVGRVVRKGGPRRSATGFSLLGGWHSDELRGADVALGDGPAGLLALRHDRQRLSLELRLGLERSTTTGQDGLAFKSQGLAPAVAALWPFDLNAFTVAIGGAVGEVFLRQSVDVGDAARTLHAAPVNPALVAPRWVTGLELGPMAQLDVPIALHGYLRVEAGLAWRAFWRTTSDATRYGGRGRFLIGLGTAF